MNPLVVDLSHWDPAQDYAKIKAAGIVGVIFKATDTNGYTDPYYLAQKAAAKGVGLKWGSYHFAHPGHVTEQAQHYLSFAKPEPDEIFCLDWETANDGAMSVDEAQSWITQVENGLARPFQCLIYSGNVAKEKLGNTPNGFFGNRRLWLAQYSNTPVVQVSWNAYWLWQFTDGQVGPQPHSIPGVGPCDINHFDRTPEQLRAEWASGTKLPTPAPTDKIVTITIDAPPGVKVIIKGVDNAS